MTLTRRSFVAGLSAMLPLGVFQQARGSRESYRIALETWSFHDADLDTMVKRVQALGVRYLELHDGHLPFTAAADQMARAKTVLSAARLVATGVYIHDAFTESEAVARPIFEYAKTMGYGYINGGPKRESLPLLNRLSSEYGIRIAIHNHGPAARYETLGHVTSVLDAYPNLRACIDIGHFARSGVDPVRATRVLSPLAVAIHIKDVDAKGENTVLGDGTIDLPGVFAAMRDSGFSGLVVLEYEGDFDDMEKRLAGMRTSLTNLHGLIEAAARSGDFTGGVRSDVRADTIRGCLRSEAEAPS
jgi:inosose dehydratase